MLADTMMDTGSQLLRCTTWTPVAAAAQQRHVLQQLLPLSAPVLEVVGIWMADCQLQELHSIVPLTHIPLKTTNSGISCTCSERKSALSRQMAACQHKGGFQLLLKCILNSTEAAAKAARACTIQHLLPRCSMIELTIWFTVMAGTHLMPIVEFHTNILTREH